MDSDTLLAEEDLLKPDPSTLRSKPPQCSCEAAISGANKPQLWSFFSGLGVSAFFVPRDF